ncbi:MAG: tRNA 2-thiouridine(34) synthase MnmA [archaeon]|nr:tRNA 2-thiouridine(34) synthase MnmA [archaeon]
MEFKKQKTIVIGMSGGVDSSVAALLLKNQGYNVIGAFMKNFSDSKNKITGECLWIQDKKDAQKIASLLNIRLVTFDFEKEYKKQVIRPMFKAYSQGLTPNPDIQCNTIIKFPLFWKYAKTKLKANYIAMGHYAKIKKTKNGFQLLAGKDKTKDQSYFLYHLSQKELSHTLFPIGDYTKSQVREIAKRHRFPNWNKQGTRGICFVGKVNMKSFLEKRIHSKQGIVLNPQNNPIGTHPGTSYFTIGQRIGSHLGINVIKPKGSEQKKWYVAKKQKNNILIVAPENHPLLKNKSVTLKSLHLINPKEKILSHLIARIRHLGQFHSGKLKKQNNKYIFTFSKPVEAIAEGQSIVLYHKSQVIGGGEISKVK